MAEFALHLNERQKKVVDFALHRFMSDAYQFADAAAQDKCGVNFKPGATEAFLRDAEELRAILKGSSP